MSRPRLNQLSIQQIRTQMLHLCNEHLVVIFSKFPFVDQVVLSRVCDRLHELIVDTLWKEKNFQDLSTNHHDLFDLEQIEYQHFFQSILHVLERFTVVQTRHQSFRGEHDELIFYGQFRFPNLRTFECYRERIGDMHIYHWARNWSALEVLILNTEYITGRYLVDMQNLQKLYIPRANIYLKWLNVILLGYALENLTHLDISGHPKPEVVKEAFRGANCGLLQLEYFGLSWNAIGVDFVRFMRYKMSSLRYLHVVGPFVHSVQTLFNRTTRIINFHWLNFVESHAQYIFEMRFQNYIVEEDTQFPFDKGCYLKLRNVRIFHASYEVKFEVRPERYLGTLLQEVELEFSEEIEFLIAFIKDNHRLEHIYISRMVEVWPDVLHIIKKMNGILQDQDSRRYPLTIHAPIISEALLNAPEYVLQHNVLFERTRIFEERLEEAFVDLQFMNRQDDNRFHDHDDTSNSDSGVVS